MADRPADLAEAPERNRRSLSYQLGLALTIALLPIGLLAAILAATNTRNTRLGEIIIAEEQFRSVGRAIESVFDEQLLVLRTLLLRRSSGSAAGSCAEDVQRAADFSVDFDSVAEVDAAGRVVCFSGAAPQSADIRKLLAAPPGDDGSRGAVYWSGGSRVLLAARDTAGSEGAEFVIASVPTGALKQRIAREVGPDAVYAVWLSGRRLAGDVLSERPATERFTVGRTEHRGRNVIGASGPLKLPALSLTTFAPATRIGASDVVPVLLPAAMLAAALLIAFLSIRRLVVGPLRAMAAGVRAYGRGEGGARISARAGAADEIHAFAEAFDTMADEAAISREKIAEALAAQQRLMREVHHRVKNNLQIVASLISIQGREAGTGEVARAYAGIQMRVNALALVHRWLFEDNMSKGVDFAALVHDLCAGLQQSVAEAERIELAVTAQIERLYVGQDSAVPLAFLITEIVAAGGHRAAAEGADTLAIAIGLARRGDGGELSLAAGVFQGADQLAVGSSGPSARIIHGMVRQLRGKISFDPQLGKYTVGFPALGGR